MTVSKGDLDCLRRFPLSHMTLIVNGRSARLCVAKALQLHATRTFELKSTPSSVVGGISVLSAASDISTLAYDEQGR